MDDAERLKKAAAEAMADNIGEPKSGNLSLLRQLAPRIRLQMINCREVFDCGKVCS